MKKLLISLSIAVASLTVFSGIFFGTSILNNLHKRFLRIKSINVVKVYDPAKGGGTGFFVKAKSGKILIMTNHHVCNIGRDTGRLLVDYYNGVATVKILKQYETNDLCLMEAPDDVRYGLSVAKSIRKGEQLYAMGHPLLEPLAITEGEISGNVILRMADAVNVTKEQCTGKGYEFTQIDNLFLNMFGLLTVCERVLDVQSSTINILPGNSGSPVVDIYGNVAGVIFAAVESGVHSYVVPLKDVKEFLNEN